MIRQVQLNKANRRADRSVLISFETSLEQSTEEFMEIDSLIGSHGFIYYKSSGELTQKEIDELDNVDLEIEGKTKSQRLRNVLFVLYQQEKSNKTWKDYYSEKMEIIIEKIKSKLD